MKSAIAFVCFVLMSFLCFASDDDAGFSTQDYMDYLNALQNPTDYAATSASLNVFDFFDAKKIEEQIQSLFAPENINRGKWHQFLEKNRHASLIVFFLAIGGIALLFYGYRLFPFLLMGFGALLGGFITANVITRFFQVSQNEFLLFVIIGAITASIGALLLKNIFVFLFGASLGLFVSQLILSLFLTEMTNTLLLMIFTAVLFGVLVFLLKRIFIYFLTSLLGSIALVFSAQYLILEMFKKASFKDQLFTFSSIVLFLVLLVSGFLIQYKINKKDLKSVI